METLHSLIDFFLHLDDQLIALVSHYGIWTYALLFIIIFCETGLVVFPFLPGDSLLFAAGALAANANDTLNIHILFLSLTIASITGNLLNYAIGRWVGPHVFYSDLSRLFNKKHLIRAHTFFETYGGKTIILARFLPIIRTFVPFVAGIAYMSLRSFLVYNVMGALLWIGSLLYLSYWFGNLEIIQNNFSLAVIAIILISFLPPSIELVRQYLKRSSR